jgi:hypothetical protein
MASGGNDGNSDDIYKAWKWWRQWRRRRQQWQRWRQWQQQRNDVNNYGGNGDSNGGGDSNDNDGSENGDNVGGGGSGDGGRNGSGDNGDNNNVTTAAVSSRRPWSQRAEGVDQGGGGTQCQGDTTMMTGWRPVASGSEVQYWGYSTSTIGTLEYRIREYRPNIALNLLKNRSCLRRFRAIFGRYLIVRYLGDPAIQNIDQISPPFFAARRA